jgi:hypothetical protein
MINRCKEILARIDASQLEFDEWMRSRNRSYKDKLEKLCLTYYSVGFDLSNFVALVNDKTCIPNSLGKTMLAWTTPVGTVELRHNSSITPGDAVLMLRSSYSIIEPKRGSDSPPVGKNCKFGVISPEQPEISGILVIN